MIDLIDGLLNDDRLPYLMRTPEFMFAKFRLMLMASRLIDNQFLPERDTDYLEQIQKHIQNICPRIVPMTVNGEEALVEIVTIPEPLYLYEGIAL